LPAADIRGVASAGDLHGSAPAPLGSAGLIAALRRIGPIAGLGVLPVAFLAFYLGAAIAAHQVGVDYRLSFWPAGDAVLHGRSPYPPLDLRVLRHGEAYVYPPLVAIAVAPLSLLPAMAATVLVTAATALAIAGAVWVVGVRDWRCYGALCLLEPVLSCIQTAAITGFLALAIALAWRRRATGWTAPVLVAVVVAAKLFLFPLLVWVAVVRGLRSAAATAAGAAALVLAPWLCGFPGLSSYRQLLSLLTDVEGDRTMTPRAIAHALGAGWTLAGAIALGVAGALAVAAVVLARRPDGQRAALLLTLLAALAASPIVWVHYLVLLLVPIAIARPRISWLWAAPALVWLAGGQPSHPDLRFMLIGFASVALTGAATLRAGRVPVPAA
jgi:hypothetical protein